MTPHYDVLVIGGGINGLATAYHLTLRQPGRVGLIEQFVLGHRRGSSHGQSRITRTTYSDVKFARLARVAHGQDWPALELAAGTRLIHQCPGCFFGPGAEGYWNGLEGQREGLELVEAGRARELFPLFGFPGGEPCVVDRTGGVVAAADALDALLRLGVQAGLDVRENCPVTQLDLTSDPLRVVTSQGVLSCGRLVVTAGSWTTRLLGLHLPLVPVRQSVGYFRLDAEPPAVQPGRFPVWAYIGIEPNDFYYGLPEFGRPGVKAARHLTSLAADDPDKVVEQVPLEALESLQAFLAAHFTVPILERVGAETCFYTNSPTQDFLLDHLPLDSRVVVGAGFSGHGFKFGPLTGRILAGLCLDGVSGVEAFERHRGDYSFAALTG